ncbi:MAG: MFS transporter [Gammaproteobacteria bacterium]|nr:MFS transporter [Gammaproteobacteria bacterium]
MGQPDARNRRVRNVFIVSSGNFLEMYDFMVFGYYAKAIEQAFFPAADANASLLLALMTFGAGFLMRPVGALLLGAYIDRHGRRQGLILTLTLMSIGTLAIAAMPTYAQIGLWAPLLVLTGRLLQGVSAGVEVGGVSVYLSEIATEGRKGFFVAWQSASQQVAVVFAAVTGLVLNSLLEPTEMSAWGWRVPFFIGSVMLPFLLLVRRALEETPEFQQRRVHPSLGAIARTVAANASVVLLGALMAMMTPVFFYMITAYTPTYGSSVLKLSPATAMLVTLCVGVCNFVMLPTMGALSDRIGRPLLLVGCAILALVSGYPALSWLASEPSFARLLGVTIWLAVVYAGYNGAMIVYLTEIMPASVRTSGFSLAYSIATAIFGGFTPAIATLLIDRTGDRAAPGLWLTAAAAISLVSVLLISRQHRHAVATKPIPQTP